MNPFCLPLRVPWPDSLGQASRINRILMDKFFHEVHEGFFGLLSSFLRVLRGPFKMVLFHGLIEKLAELFGEFFHVQRLLHRCGGRCVV
jgi:hypothetical protein